MDSVTMIRIVAGVIALVIWPLAIWILARIFSKAGYSPWWGALGLLLGLGVLIALLMLAFGDWPVLRQRQQGMYAANTSS
jgi:hypothetical protein